MFETTLILLYCSDKKKSYLTRHSHAPSQFVQYMKWLLSSQLWTNPLFAEPLAKVRTSHYIFPFLPIDFIGRHFVFMGFLMDHCPIGHHFIFFVTSHRYAFLIHDKRMNE